tara:strand:- start:38108 stop:39286 length:1179 start_codon:yes stop_codon:yes gene_type:complete
METWLVFLLSLFFLALGLLVGFQFSIKKKSNSKPSNLSGNMKHRLQLFFDSYSDESIDRFIQSLKVTSDTLPLHISIGKHFRTQGELEKAILVHQNLMSHPELSSKASENIIYELAKDYKAAGLFDRAQALLHQLRESKQFAVKSLKLLLDIHEAEKDWLSALNQASKIDLKKYKDIELKVSQYHCEIADQYIKEGLIREAVGSYKQALSIYKECHRAHFGLAKLSYSNQDYSGAIQHIKSMILIAPEQIPSVLSLLLDVTKDTSSFESHQQYLSKLLRETGQVPIMLAIVESMTAEGNLEKAGTFLYEYLNHSPSIAGLSCFFKLYSSSNYTPEDVITLIVSVLDMVQLGKQNYKCGSCGFSSSQLHWQCPSCKNWQTIKPIIEYETVFQK